MVREHVNDRARDVAERPRPWPVCIPALVQDERLIVQPYRTRGITIHRLYTLNAKTHRRSHNGSGTRREHREKPHQRPAAQYPPVIQSGMQKKQGGRLLSIRLGDDVVAELDACAAHLHEEYERIRVSRADAIRWLLARGIMHARGSRSNKAVALELVHAVHGRKPATKLAKSKRRGE